MFPYKLQEYRRINTELKCKNAELKRVKVTIEDRIQNLVTV